MQDNSKTTRLSALPWLLFIVAIAALFVSQYKAIVDLWAAWQTEEYSHGILIPLIALFLGWQRLDKSKPILEPSLLAVPCLILAGALQVLAQLSAFETLAEYGLIIGIVAIALGFLGTRATWILLPALVYLVFAIPLPHLIQANLSGDMQLLSSTLGVMILDLIHIPVFQDGNVIDLGGYKLQVVEACSGLRYLFPLMSFGFLASLLIEDRLWKRALVFLSTIPITIGMNALRIAFIGVTVDEWGPDMAEGFIHTFEGWTVFGFCILILLVESWLLLKIKPRGHFRYDYFDLKRPSSFQRINRLVPQIIVTLIAITLAIFANTKALETRAEVIPVHTPLTSFPLSLDNWQGHQDTLPSDILDALQLTDYWMADYNPTPAAPSVNLYIAYYESQRIGVTTHSPSNCIPGGGWQIASSAVKTVPLASGRMMKVTELVIRKENEAQIVYYWFDERGRDITETISAKWYLLWDSILMHRTDGALIRLLTPVEHEDQAHAEERLNGFLSTATPAIDAFIPGAPAIGVAAP